MLEGVWVATGSTISDCVAVGWITISVLATCKVGIGVALAAGSVLLGFNRLGDFCGYTGSGALEYLCHYFWRGKAFEWLGKV